MCFCWLEIQIWFVCVALCSVNVCIPSTVCLYTESTMDTMGITLLHSLLFDIDAMYEGLLMARAGRGVNTKLRKDE